MGLATRIGEWTTVTEAETSRPDEEAEAVCVQPVAIIGITSFVRPTYLLSHLCSGRRRQGGLQHYIELVMVELGVHTTVVSLGVQAGARMGGLASPKMGSFWEAEIERGRVVAMLAVPVQHLGVRPVAAGGSRGRNQCGRWISLGDWRV